MAFGTFLLIILVVVLVLAAVLVLASRKPQLSKDQRAELKELRALKKSIERLAIQNSDVNPELSYQIRDEINQYELKELN